MTYPLFLPDFKETNFFDRFSNNTRTSTLKKVRPVEAELFHVDGHEANSQAPFAILRKCLKRSTKTEVSKNWHGWFITYKPYSGLCCRLRYGLHSPELEAPWRHEIFLFAITFRPALRPTSPPIPWVPGFFPGRIVKFTTRIRLEARIRISGAIPLLLYSFVVWTQNLPYLSIFILAAFPEYNFICCVCLCVFVHGNWVRTWS
jgi:hypothetical protein